MPDPVSRYHDAFPLGGIDAGLLEIAQLRGVRAALVAARDERRLRVGNALQRGRDVLAAGDLRGIGLRSDQHEVVVHDVAPIDAGAFGDELVLGRAIVHEHDVGVAATADVERLARADARRR